MGTWGPGLFENDCAVDFTAQFVHVLVKEINEAVADPSKLEPDSYYGDVLPCLVKFLSSVYSLTRTGAVPEPHIVREWKSKYMSVWEKHITGMKPKRGYKTKRRAALLETFDKLARQARQAHPITAEDIVDRPTSGLRPETGGIYSIHSPDGFFRTCKIVEVGKKHLCILIYDAQYETRPKSINPRRMPPLMPAHPSGWMVGAYKISRFQKREPQLLIKTELTADDRTYLNAWKSFGGLSLTPPD